MIGMSQKHFFKQMKETLLQNISVFGLGCMACPEVY